MKICYLSKFKNVQTYDIYKFYVEENLVILNLEPIGCKLLKTNL